MEPDSRMLQEILELSRENNRMIRAMRRASFWGGLFRIFWLLLIIGVPLWAYFHFFQPYYDSLQHSFTAAKASTTQFQTYMDQMPEPVRQFLNLLGFKV